MMRRGGAVMLNSSGKSNEAMNCEEKVVPLPHYYTLAFFDAFALCSVFHFNKTHVLHKFRPVPSCKK